MTGSGGPLSYAGTFPNPWQAGMIRSLEWATGKLTLLRMIRRFEAMGVPQGQAFWAQALAVMGIRIETPPDEIARIPRDGPLIVVANHPHGLVDGMVLAALIGQVRQDYKILTRSLLTEVDEIRQFMIPVPFPHEDDAQERSLDMRRQAMAHLAAGGVVALFPSGAVASSDTLMGPAVERPWNPFTAKMIQRSGATVLPVRFPGQNSRAYQIAARLSATVRQGLLLHEVVHATGRPAGSGLRHRRRPLAVEAGRGGGGGGLCPPGPRCGPPPGILGPYRRTARVPGTGSSRQRVGTGSPSPR